MVPCTMHAANLAQELDLVALNLAYDHDLHLCQEMESKIRNSVPKSGKAA